MSGTAAPGGPSRGRVEDAANTGHQGYGLPAEPPGPRGTLPPPPPSTAARRRWLVWTGVAAIVVVLVVAGLTWFGRTPLGVVARAVSATLERSSAATRVESTVVGIPLVGDVSLLVSEGEVDFETQEARFRRRLVSGVETELRYTREGTFVRVPLADRWVAVTRPGDGETPETDPDVTAVAPGLGNPVALLGLLRSLESTPSQVGRDEVAGDPVTLYEVVVDLDATAQLLGSEGRAAVEALRRLTGGGELPLTVAIDDDILIRAVRFTTRVPVSPSFTVRVDNAIEFSEFDVPVDVSAPPDDQIVEFDPSALPRLDPFGAIRDLLRGIPGLGIRGAA